MRFDNALMLAMARAQACNVYRKGAIHAALN